MVEAGTKAPCCLPPHLLVQAPASPPVGAGPAWRPAPPATAPRPPPPPRQQGGCRAAAGPSAALHRPRPPGPVARASEPGAGQSSQRGGTRRRPRGGCPPPGAEEEGRQESQARGRHREGTMVQSLISRRTFARHPQHHTTPVPLTPVLFPCPLPSRTLPFPIPAPLTPCAYPLPLPSLTLPSATRIAALSSASGVESPY